MQLPPESHSVHSLQAQVSSQLRVWTPQEPQGCSSEAPALQAPSLRQMSEELHTPWSMHITSTKPHMPQGCVLISPGLQRQSIGASQASQTLSFVQV